MIFATMNILTEREEKGCLKLFEELAQLTSEAVVLGGSRAGEQYDQDSDYDVYVYLKSSDCPKYRRKLLEAVLLVCKSKSIWELKMTVFTNNEIEIEFIYHFAWMILTKEYRRFLEHQPHNAYTTLCKIWLLLHSKVLYDQGDRYSSLQNKCHIPLPWSS